MAALYDYMDVTLPMLCAAAARAATSDIEAVSGVAAVGADTSDTASTLKVCISAVYGQLYV